MKVKRVWEGKDFIFDCYVSENVYQDANTSKIKVGDKVIVYYVEGNREMPLVMAAFHNYTE